MGAVVAFPNQPRKLSIRAASWVAASCVKHFCMLRAIENSDIEDFCKHLEMVVAAESVPEWDEAGNFLVVTGYGDPLPNSLQQFEKLSEILDCAREITGSQLYGAWTPHEVVSYLSRVASLAGIDPAAVVSRAISLHDPGNTGWGLPVMWTEVQPG